MTEIEKYQKAEEILLGLVLGFTGRIPEDRTDNPPAEITSVEEATGLIHELYTDGASQ